MHAENESTGNRRFRRNVFTGVLEEIWDDPAVEFEAQNEKMREKTAHMVRKSSRHVNPWDTGKDHICKAMSIKPEEATPARIAWENEQSKRHGTGAYYDKQGNCYTPTRGSRSKEMRRPHRGGFRYQDNDAGYGDYAGR